MIYKSALSTSEIVDLSRYHLLKDNSNEKIFFKLRPESISERLGTSAHLLGVSHYDLDLQGNVNEEQEGEREMESAESAENENENEEPVNVVKEKKNSRYQYYEESEDDEEDDENKLKQEEEDLFIDSISFTHSLLIYT